MICFVFQTIIIFLYLCFISWRRNSIKFLSSTLRLILLLYIPGVPCIWWNYQRRIICIVYRRRVHIHYVPRINSFVPQRWLQRLIIICFIKQRRWIICLVLQRRKFYSFISQRRMICFVQRNNINSYQTKNNHHLFRLFCLKFQVSPMNTTNNIISLCITTNKFTFGRLKKIITLTKKKHNSFYSMNFNDITHPRSVLDLCGAK